MQTNCRWRTTKEGGSGGVEKGKREFWLLLVWFVRRRTWHEKIPHHKLCYQPSITVIKYPIKSVILPSDSIFSGYSWTLFLSQKKYNPINWSFKYPRPDILPRKLGKVGLIEVGPESLLTPEELSQRLNVPVSKICGRLFLDAPLFPGSVKLTRSL